MTRRSERNCRLEAIPQALTLRLFPLAVALIIFSTAIPVELQAATALQAVFEPVDFVANVLLYAPLGIALRKYPLLLVMTGAMTLSTLIELQQLWSPTRHASLFDVIANTCGALIGALLARRLTLHGYETDTLRVRGPFGRICVAMAVLLSISAIPVTPNHLDEWDAEFTLQLGNESTGDRPWRGSISALVVGPTHLSSDEVASMADPENLELRSVLLAANGYALPEPVTLDGGSAVPIAVDVSEQLARRAMERNAFSVVARIIPADLEQEGPARIISFSRDQFNRNFDLGQERRRVVFRVRTPTAGPNGNDARAETIDFLERNSEVTITATYDGAVSRIYVDGQLHGRRNLAARGCIVPTLCDTGLPLVRGLFGASLAIVALVALKPHTLRLSLLIVLIAATSGTAVVRSLGVALNGDTSAWIDVLPLFGGLVIAVAVVPPSMRSNKRLAEDP